MDRGVATEPLEHLSEQRIRLPVVQRHVGRRPHDRHDARAIEAELVHDTGLRGKPMEVVLLLQTRVAAHLGRARTEAVETLLRDHLRNDDAPAPHDSRSRAGRVRTRSRRRTTKGSPANERSSAARARRARARGRTRAAARSRGARAADRPSHAPFRVLRRLRVVVLRHRARCRTAREAPSSARTPSS